MQKAISTIDAHRKGATPPDGATGHGLWQVLDQLALCRRDYDLTANSLSVLRALISFLPKGPLPQGTLLVWPSNKALCERADGMDERTLRRHLDRLVSAGFISRRASSNGKRFALRFRSAVVNAFGFDLAPFRASAPAIDAAARSARDTAEQVAALRVEILNLLQALARTPGSLPDDTEADIRKALRRRIDPQTLAETRDALSMRLPAESPFAEQLTGSDSQIDRHLQNTEEDSIESVCAAPGKETPAKTSIGRTCAENQADTDLTLADCLDATTESRAFAQQPVQSWADLMRLAQMLAPMIGIGTELAEHAKRAMGPLQAAITTLCIIQKSRHIHRPAAYFRKLALLAEEGKYSLRALVNSAAGERFAAANHA